jgi:E-phenylitaconyl-CoA hydratase
MDLENLTYAKRGRIAIVTINRPEVDNGIDRRTLTELAEVWTDFKNDNELYVAIITAAGSEAFCSGLEEAYRSPQSAGPAPLRLSDRDEGTRTITAKNLACWKPVIAAINGRVVGGGLHFVVDADIVICSENATFSDAHNFGSAAAIWEPIQLSRKVPYEVAMRMTLMGPKERLSASRAFDVGLVSQVVPTPDLLPTAIAIAEQVAEGDIYALMATVEATYKGLELGMMDAVRQGLLLRQLATYKKRLGATAEPN